MRISPRLAVQFINSDPAGLVFVNDQTGQEVVQPCTVEVIRALMEEIFAATSPDQRWEVGGIELTGAELVGAAYALGYFTGVVKA